jgi:hypothetical protein
MLDDPVANFEMPPQVEVEHAELQLECELSNRSEQRRKGA